MRREPDCTWVFMLEERKERELMDEPDMVRDGGTKLV